LRDPGQGNSCDAECEVVRPSSIREIVIKKVNHF